MYQVENTVIPLFMHSTTQKPTHFNWSYLLITGSKCSDYLCDFPFVPKNNIVFVPKNTQEGQNRSSHTEAAVFH